MVFGTPVAEVTGEERSRIKATSYGLAYGLSSYGLAAQLGIPVPEAAALRDRYFERFGKVRDYLEDSSPRLAPTATRRPCSVADATCPTCAPPTASAERWPNAPPSTRRSKAVPPILSRSP